MKDNTRIRARAIRAMKAVTAGALLCAGIACTADDDPPEPEWELNSNNGDANITSDDAGSDTLLADADAGVDCNDQESNGVCPDHCHMDNDIDCCEDVEYGYGYWDEEYGCAVAVPGPFVPPRMTA